MNKKQLLEYYESKTARLRKELTESFQRATQFQTQNNKESLNEYLSCIPKLIEFQETESILRSLDFTNDELQKGPPVVEQKIRKAIAETLAKPLTSFDELAFFIIHTLLEQIKLNKSPVIVSHFTYRDLKIGSTFSKYLKSLLEKEIITSGKLTIYQYHQTENTTKPESSFVLNGNYWEDGSKIRFFANLISSGEGKIIASTIAEMDSNLISKSALNYKPDNFPNASNDIKLFNTNELTPGGLSLSVWTNKGNDDIVFSKGERMQVYAKVNMPCYLRFVYHLANGRRAVLLKNYHLDESNINMPYKIPYDFECDAPFGAEILQVFASTERFDPVFTNEQDGYEMLAEDLTEFVTNTRGIKKIEPGVMKAETRIVITTLEF